MRITLTWLRMDARRRWQSLVILGLLMALATTTVLAAIAGSRRGDTAMGRLLDKTRPATLTVLPNQPGFNWAPIRALPEVETLTTFAVVGFDIKGNPVASQNVSFPFTDSHILRTIERPIVLQGRVLNPDRVDEVNVSGQFLKANGKKLGDTPHPEPGQPEADRRPVWPIGRWHPERAADPGPHRGRDPVAVVHRQHRGHRGPDPQPGAVHPLPGQLHGPPQRHLYQRAGPAQGWRGRAGGLPG